MAQLAEVVEWTSLAERWRNAAGSVRELRFYRTPDQRQKKAVGGARLMELRVLDGPNRFFNRPAVKLEFTGRRQGAADAAAERAAEVLRELHAKLRLPAPSLARRGSADGRRAVVAFPWRRRTLGQAMGAVAAEVALGRRSMSAALAEVRSSVPGPLPAVPTPRVPVVAVTGTNGKTTVTRLVAHIAAGAGLRVGMTNSDGIYLDGQLVEAGDWTGYVGATRVLSEPAIDVAVLETARGGVLLRGIGYRHNNVGVVTNVSADHLGLQGIDTLDELAEVKAAIVRMTKRDGWAVLNADDARVWAMRRSTRAGIYAFGLDPGSAAACEAVEGGGRAALLDDGWLVLRRPSAAAFRLARAEELPVTVGGLSRENVANALAAAAAADGLGIDRRRIADGLRSFRHDAGGNPGRFNLYRHERRLVVIDFAHNEAGLAGLLEVCRALAGKGRVCLGLGTAGDRTDEMLRGLGRVAAAADRVVIAEKPHYLRGRDREEMNALLREGLAEAGGAGAVEAYPTEAGALEGLLRASRPGDVVAVMAHAERLDLLRWLESAGARPLDAEDLRSMLAARAAPERA